MDGAGSRPEHGAGGTAALASAGPCFGGRQSEVSDAAGTITVVKPGPSFPAAAMNTTAVITPPATTSLPNPPLIGTSMYSPARSGLVTAPALRPIRTQ